MRKRHVKFMAAGALAAAMVIANLPVTSTLYMDSVSVSKAAETEGTVLDLSTLGSGTHEITESGTYTITGDASKVFIQVSDGVEAKLILNNMNIDNSSAGKGAVIEALGSSDVDIELKGASTIKCSTDKKENAILHDDYTNTMTFSGAGSLTITNALKDAIKYDEGTIEIKSGSIVLADCYSDGIQAENVNISGGTVDITTVYDKASENIYGKGLSNDITENGSTKVETVKEDTGSHKGIKAGTKAKTYSYSEVKSESDNVAGQKYSQTASGGITISGGTVKIDTTAAGIKANSVSTSGYTATSKGTYIIGGPDDALHSNNDLAISGGTIILSSGDDAITAEGNLDIAGGTINIETAYEGIEGAYIDIGTSGSSSGPNITINSNDDGINAARKTSVYVYADEDEEVYTKTTTAQSGNYCNIYSGSVEVNIDSTSTKSVTLGSNTIKYKASGDGIDCNGTLDIEGGTTIVYGQSTGDNSPLDTDSGFTLGNGATVLAAGSNSMAGESIPSSGSGVYLTYGSTGNMGNAAFGGAGGMGGMSFGRGASQASGSSASITAGSAFKVTDGSATIYSGTLKNAASFVFFASPDLTSGTSYTLTAGSSSTSVTAASAGSTVNGAQNAMPTQTFGGEMAFGMTPPDMQSQGNDTTATSGGGSVSGSSSSATASVSSSETSGGTVEDFDDSVVVSDDTTAEDVVLTTDTDMVKGDSVSVADTKGNEVSYTITGSSTVSYNVEDTYGKKVIVPNTVTINDATYRVTKIEAGALKDNDEITRVVIGENVKTIGAKAFANCDSLKTITVDGSVLKTVGKKAFKGISKNATIKVSGTKKQVKAVKKLIKASGVASTVKVKKA